MQFGINSTSDWHKLHEGEGGRGGKGGTGNGERGGGQNFLPTTYSIQLTNFISSKLLCKTG